ncbi:N-acetylmuramoyl-L-alanine amidase [Clostridium tarantellae]|uniref:N-acetylmuramoyl-L-alanine amidase n=1 Tax=Clostridium tarantellae TaxID=39493 RepID=A0A6I1MQE1_9CLOT|nr:N-acetylmuramoyl-L-alanine amidase [Clostridium tarantellae]MPQ44698.1 N-acetylmuramoyl-L-alanine amidase [Clostridium tarantellae]
MKYIYLCGIILLGCIFFICTELFLNNDKINLDENINTNSQVEEVGPEFMPSPFYYIPVNKEELKELIEKDKIKKEEAKKQEELASAKKDEEEKLSSTNKTDNSKITIVLDPGHASKANLEKEPIEPNSKELKIKDGGGATGVVSKVPEYKICMRIALLLRDELTSLGFNAIMTKEDNNIALGNVDRANIGNNANANLVVRIHADGASSPSAKGASVLVPDPSNKNTKGIYEASYNYGEKIINTYCSELNIKNRGVIHRNDMTGFNWSKVPVILLEMGFLSNKEEDLFLSNEENALKISKAIAKGILQCFQ